MFNSFFILTFTFNQPVWSQPLAPMQLRRTSVETAVLLNEFRCTNMLVKF